VPVAKTSSKGQVLIPADLRREIGLEPGTYVMVERVADGVILRPLGRNLIEATHGMFADAGPVTDALIAERRAEAAAEEALLPPPKKDEGP